MSSFSFSFGRKQPQKRKSILDLSPLVPAPIEEPFQFGNTGINALDLFSVGNYASTKFFDTLSNKGYGILDILNPAKYLYNIGTSPVSFISSIVESGYEAVKEGINTAIPSAIDLVRLVGDSKGGLTPGIAAAQLSVADKIGLSKASKFTFSDLIKKNYPKEAEENPVATSVLGFIADIAFDPTTYISFGSSLPKVAGKQLTQKGVGVVKDLFKEAAEGFVIKTKEKSGLIHSINFGIDDIKQLKLIEETLGDDAVLKAIQDKIAPLGDEIERRAMTSIEQKRSVEQSFLNLTRSDPKLFQKGNLGVYINIPFAGDVPIISSNVVNKVYEATGLKKISDSISDSLLATPVELFKTGIVRDQNINKLANGGLYKDIRQTLFGQKNRIDFEVVNSTARIFDLPVNERNNLIVHAAKMDQLINDAEQGAKKFASTDYRDILPEDYTGTFEELIPLVPATKILPIAKQFGLPPEEIIQASLLGKREITEILKGIDKTKEVIRHKFYTDLLDQRKNNPGKLIDVDVTKLNDKYVINADQLNTTVDDITQLDQWLKDNLLNRVSPIKRYPKIAVDKVTLDNQTIAKLRSEYLNKALNNKEISQKQFDSLTKYVDTTTKLNQLAMDAGLYEHSVKNFNPAIYLLGKNKYKKILDMPEDEIIKPFSKYGYDLEKATAEGFNKELDLAVYYAMRTRATMYNVAQRQFEDSVDNLFTDVITIGGKEKEIVNIPDVIKKDIQFIGNSLYSDSASKQYKQVMNTYLAGLNAFKQIATVVKPSFGLRQFIANPLQAFVTIGPSAFKAYDPRSVISAGMILLDKSAYRKKIPKFLTDAVEKFGTIEGKMLHAVNRYEPELVNQLNITTRLGENVTGPQLFNELIENNIINKGQVLLDLDLQKDFNLELAKANGWWEFQKAKFEGAWKTGYLSFIKESLPWINIAGEVENLARASTYINARKLGYLPKEAMERTNKALFDYKNGLSVFEKRVMQRLVPFYTFQRFAVPLIASLVKQPGRAVTLKKITEEFFEVWNLYSSNQELTESQRQVLPGFLLEQPHVFDSYQNDKGIFRTFNNYSFTDFLSLVEFDINGSIDLNRTTQKVSLAQLTPILKVPVELFLTKQNTFTGLPISASGKIATGEAIETFDNMPDLIKELISYEKRPDLTTGEQKGYVNPYLIYLSSSFAPFVNDFVHIPKDDMNAQQFAFRFLTGIGTMKLDFQKEQRGRIREWQEKIKESQKEMRRHQLAGMKDAVNEDHKNLQLYLKEIQGLAQLNVK